MSNKELITEKTKKLEERLQPRKFFSERQIKNTEESFSKWLHFIIAESGYGKIEVDIDIGLGTIDVRPSPSFRYH